MKTYTVLAYNLPAGGHHIESLAATDATDAVLRLRAKLALVINELEVVAVVSGTLDFELVDAARVALAPYSAASP